MKEVKNIRNTWNIGILIILSTILAMSGMAANVAAADGFPALPVNEFAGTVTVDGDAVPDGTTISAYIDDVFKGSVTTTAGKYGYDLEYLTVQGNADDTITFKIGGEDADQTTAFRAGYGPQNLSLSIDTPSGDPDPPSGDPDPPSGDPDPPSGGSATGGDIGSGSGAGPGIQPADGATAPGDGDGLTPESHESTGADGEAAPATEDEPGPTGFPTGSGATVLAVVGLLVLIALIAFVIKRRT